MKAPDKIYCGNNGRGNLSYSSQPFLDAKEYIRKDALIEWAKEKQEQTISIREDAWWDEVINKIKSM